MPISDTSRLNRSGLQAAMPCRSGLPAGRFHGSGLRTAASGPNMKTQAFTLLEMMVVMAIIALAMGIVVPRLATMADSFGAASERETVIEAVASLGLVARSQGRRIDFNGDTTLLPGELPDDWQAIPEAPITFHASGACDGGTVRVIGREREFIYELAPPRCRVTLVD